MNKLIKNINKASIFTNVISNIIIIVMIFALYVACVPTNFTAVFKPIYRVDTQDNSVAIMINVYEGAEQVEEMMAIMERYSATCTFFVGGIWASKNPQTLKKMAERAEIGNHGYLHRDHAKLNEKQNRDEILLCEKQVEELTGIKTNLFAPPSGSIGDTMLKVCENLDYKVIMWSKDTIDWRDKDYQLILKRATSDVKSGDMILMHPTEQTVKALPLILDCYKNKKLKTVTVSELLYGDKAY
ncbi:MAG: polysaccharide deacetylase family protein [Clostridiales bacterium]|nr:polysaccharide deacetylase family protein [Clostridiales bacterium]